MWFHMFTRILFKSASLSSSCCFIEGDQPLTPIDVILLLQLLHSDRHAILRKHDIALLHLLTCGVGHFLDDAVDDEADDGKNGDHDEEDNKREEACSGHFLGFECSIDKDVVN